MANKQKSASAKKTIKPIIQASKPWLIALSVGLIGLVLLIQACFLPITHSYARIGSGFMVLVVGAGLFLCGLILAWQIKHGEKFEPQETEDVDTHHKPDKKALYLVSLACISAIIAIPFLGFPIGITIVFCLIAHAFLEKNWLKSAIIGFIFASIIWFGFKTLGLQLGKFLPFLGAKWIV